MKISSETEIFKRDRKFQARFIFFNLWALRDSTIGCLARAPLRSEDATAVYILWLVVLIVPMKEQCKRSAPQDEIDP